MKLKTIIAHTSIPAIFAAGVFIYALNKESFSLGMLVSVFFGGFLFYAAPYFLWTVIVAIFKTSDVVAHAGFIANTVALVLIASFWFFPSDPSGLPLQWMLYWPLALLLLIIIAGSTATYIRIYAPNKAPRSTLNTPR